MIFLNKKYFSFLPGVICIFPKERYWVAHRLLERGYLNLASQVIDGYSPRKHEQHIKNRIDSMNDINANGLEVNKKHKKHIEEINILFAVHNSLPYDKAGYAIRTHMLAINLQKIGINTFVATRAGYPWDLQKHRTNTAKCYQDNIDNIEYLRLYDTNKTFKKGDDFNYINTYANELADIATKKNITVIHAHSNYLNGLAAIEASNKLKIPSVYEIRGLWHLTRLTLDSQYRHAGMFDYEQTMEKGAADAADAVVTISDALKNLITTWGIDEKKIHVIPNAVDTTLFTPQEKDKQLLQKYNLQNKIVIGFIGSLTGYEGLKELILAVDTLIKEGLNISLMIIGEGRVKNNLKQLSDSKDIIFTGRIPFEKVSQYYTLFDICPFPRNNVEVCRYVPPLKILEAMAMKKAIIVSNVAPLLEIVNHEKNGLVCQADNITSLKETISILYTNKQLREGLASNAYEWVHTHRSWRKMALKYQNLYELFRCK